MQSPFAQVREIFISMEVHLEQLVHLGYNPLATDITQSTFPLVADTHVWHTNPYMDFAKVVVPRIIM